MTGMDDETHNADQASSVFRAVPTEPAGDERTTVHVRSGDASKQGFLLREPHYLLCT